MLLSMNFFHQLKNCLFLNESEYYSFVSLQTNWKLGILIVKQQKLSLFVKGMTVFDQKGKSQF